MFRSRHHHVLHDRGWNAKLRPDCTIEHTDPRGQVRTTQPPGRVHDLFALADRGPAP